MRSIWHTFSSWDDSSSSSCSIYWRIQSAWPDLPSSSDNSSPCPLTRTETPGNSSATWLCGRCWGTQSARAVDKTLIALAAPVQQIYYKNINITMKSMTQNAIKDNHQSLAFRENHILKPTWSLRECWNNEELEGKKNKSEKEKNLKQNFLTLLIHLIFNMQTNQEKQIIFQSKHTLVVQT